jgi:hypothetical protein
MQASRVGNNARTDPAKQWIIGECTQWRGLAPVLNPDTLTAKHFNAERSLPISSGGTAVAFGIELNDRMR